MLFLIFVISYAHADITSWTLPKSYSALSSLIYPYTGPSPMWTNAHTIYSLTSNATYTLQGNRKTSPALCGTNFSFTIPDYSTILGITVRFNIGNSKMSTLQNVKLISTISSFTPLINNGKNVTSATFAPMVEGPTSDPNGWVEYGGTNETWGQNWTVNSIKDSDFGVCFQEQADTGTTTTFHCIGIQIQVTFIPPPICPVNLTNPINGASGDCGSTPVTYPNNCSTICNPGYTATPAPTRTCQSMGILSALSFPSCTAITCPGNPSAPTNGMAGTCADPVIFPNTCNTTCNPGYTATTSPTRSCQTSGALSTLSTQSCTAIICPGYPIAPINGIAGACANSVTFPNTCTTTCNPGYTATSAPTRSCQSNGTLSSLNTPECLAVTCPGNSIAPINGLAGGCANPITFPNTCNTTCPPGYTVVEAPTRTCQSNGILSPLSTPECIAIDCGPYPTPNNSVLSCLDTHYPNTCSFQCNDYFVPKLGEYQPQCQEDGTWSFIGECIAVPCSTLDLPIPGNGSLSFCDTTSSPNYCNITCNPGYLLIGENTTTCQTNFTWSLVGECSAIDCESLTPIANVTGLSCPDSHYPSSCDFGCDDGYEVDGVATASCHTNGTWLWNGYCKPVTCLGDSTGSMHGSAGACASSITFLNTCQTICNEGYTATAAPTRTCQSNGSLSSFNTACTAVDCGAYPTPNNASLSCPDTHYPNNCSFQCNQYFEPYLGQYQPQCQANGTWSFMGECRAIVCNDSSAPTNGNAGTCTNIKAPNTCENTCNSGYRLSTGSLTRTCQESGMLTALNAVCTVLCPADLSALANGAAGTCNTSALDGEQCSNVCQDGWHLLNGSLIRTCNGGIWTTSNYECNGCPVDQFWNNAAQKCDKCDPNAHSPFGSSFRMNCTCNSGYTGEGIFCVPERTDVVTSSAEITIRLVNTSITNSTEFIQLFIHDVSTALNISVDQIQNVGFKQDTNDSNSVTVTFVMTTSPKDNRTITDLVTDFRDQMGQKDSRLYEGDVTKQTDPTYFLVTLLENIIKDLGSLSKGLLIGILVGVIGCLILLYLINRRVYPKAKNIRLLMTIFSIVCLAANISFIIWLSQLNGYDWAYYLALLAIIVPFCVNFSIIGTLLRIELSTNEKFRQWRADHSHAFVVIWLLGALRTQNALLMKSRAFNWDVFSSPLSWKTRNRFVYADLFSILTGDIPLLITQIFLSLEFSFQTTAFVALAFTGLRLFLSLLYRLYTCTLRQDKNSKPLSRLRTSVSLHSLDGSGSSRSEERTPRNVTPVKLNPLKLASLKNREPSTPVTPGTAESEFSYPQRDVAVSVSAYAPVSERDTSESFSANVQMTTLGMSVPEPSSITRQTSDENI